MIKNQKQTAILIFAFSSQKEANSKVFDKSKELFQQLNQKTFKKAQKTGIDVLVFTEKEQKGENFGERFSNAIQSVFNQGYQQVVTIGNDSPNLKTQHILKALENLQNNTTTLGPSYDGGTYLIGLQKKHFNKESFKKITWKTRKVFSELKKYFKTHNSSIAQLNYLADIDSKTDICFFIDLLKTSFLILRNFFSLKISNTYPTFKTSYTSKNFSATFYNKGSPYIL